MRCARQLGFPAGDRDAVNRVGEVLDAAFANQAKTKINNHPATLTTAGQSRRAHALQREGTEARHAQRLVAAAQADGPAPPSAGRRRCPFARPLGG